MTDPRHGKAPGRLVLGTGARREAVLATSPTSSVSPAAAPVQMPELSLSTYRALVADLQTQQPDNRDRIGRGLDVLMGADLYETAECGVYLVQSCRESGTFYKASGLHCSCPDH